MDIEKNNRRWGILMAIDSEPIPCTECLVFVLCKNRQKIECDVLRTYIRKAESSSWLNRWDKVDKLFDCIMYLNHHGHFFKG